MPKAQANPAVDARRVAALLAGFDLDNGSEEEAISKARALRRMAANANIRIVDLLELPDVRKAVDDQMQPRRHESEELQEAQELAASLAGELNDRMGDVTKLANQLREQEETSETLRQQLAANQTQSSGIAGMSAPSLGVPSWGFEMGTVLLAVMLICAALVTGKFREGSNGNGVGKRQGNNAAVVHQGGTVRPVPELRVLPHRNRSVGPAARTR